MALVSPGIEIQVIDESQYLPSALGTIPLVLIATTQDKKINGLVAPGTTKANAGKIYGITSQRELAATFGLPKFRRSVNDTPLHADETNEYGLMAAYSALGLGNRAWVVRADVDLDSLIGTTVRPLGNSANGTNWFDTGTTAYGIYEFDETIALPASPFKEITPHVISDATKLSSGVPLSSVGNIGDYAVVVTTANNFVYKKISNNSWAPLGSSTWADDIPVVISTMTGVMANLSDPTEIPSGSTLTINGVTVTANAAVTTMSLMASTINNAAVTGVTASVANDRLQIKVDATAKSGGPTAAADGEMIIADGTNTPLATIGIAAGTYRRARIAYGGFAAMPLWRRANTSTARPNGSVWIKTSVEGSGANFVYKRYASASDSWTSLGAKLYSDGFTALYGLDPSGGGANIGAGSVFVKYDPLNNGNVGFKVYTQRIKGQTKVTGSATAPVFTVNDRFTIIASQPGTATPTTSVTATVTGTTAQAFVTAILSANVPNVTAQVESTGAVTIIHKTGGIISLAHLTNTTTTNISTCLTVAGFDTSTPVTGLVADVVTGSINLTNFFTTAYTYSASAPQAAPPDGTMWYYDDPTAVDIMISDSTGWKGYKNVTADARGYNLANTDPAGVIVSATRPETQSTNNPLQSGDLWLDTSDLENYPKIYRYDQPSDVWTLIDNSDQISQNGIIFADARWDATYASATHSGGILNPVTGAYPSTAAMLSSDYIDLDAPDYRLYPRGTLLFNTRRSGFIVKKFVENYFNDVSFPTKPTVPGSPSALPTQRNAWVSQIGYNLDGHPLMGRHAQRNEVVQAMKAAIDANPALREEGYNYTLLTAPGYPELVQNLVALNNDRSQTGFIIGDLPMTLPSTMGELVNYSNTVATNASPYLALYYPSALSNDLDGNDIVVPASHMMLRAYLYNDQVSYQWFAPAGTRRGLIDNARAIGYVDANSGEFVLSGLNNSIRDSMYENRLNPITLLPGVGLVAYGQKTRQGTASAMDRVNVARLINYLRTVLQGVANQFLFEPNDKITRDQVKQLIESLLNDLISKRGLYDYLVVCDETNNTSDRIARNELYVDIAIEPVRAVEFIYIPLRLKNPGTIDGSATA